MKKNVFTKLVLLFSVTAVMASNPSILPDQMLREQIIEILEIPNIEFESEIIQANIFFTLNQKGEIVVLTIDTDNPLLESYIKGKLNYRKIKSGMLTSGKEYQINFKLIKNIG